MLRAHARHVVGATESVADRMDTCSPALTEHALATADTQQGAIPEGIKTCHHRTQTEQANVTEHPPLE